MTRVPHSFALLTDLYELTMAYGYWRAGKESQEAAFHVSFRENPFGGGYAVAAGLADVIDYLQSLRFSDDDLAYLGTLRGNDGNALFDRDYLEHLSRFEFTCDVDAIPEGTVVFPHEPLVRVCGPIAQAQIVETALLNFVNFQTLIATKATRVVLAANGDPVLDFGLRRAQGVDGALTASRAAYIGGCAGTSNVLAGARFGIPVRGTHAHSWVMSFPSEQEAFDTYARIMPNNALLLVDTYATLDGVAHAIETGKRLRAAGHELAGIRLDSGDLAYLSIQARWMLDEAGFPKAGIAATNDLDEHLIASLKQQGARIDVWGVGTRLITAYDQPALGGVYKLTALRDAGGPWQYKVKLSEQAIKISNPGILQVRRFFEDGQAAADMIFSEDLGEPARTIVDPLDLTRRKQIDELAPAEDLLVPVFRRGTRVYEPPPLEQIRARRAQQLELFHGGVKRLDNPHRFPVGLEQQLFDLKTELCVIPSGARNPPPQEIPRSARDDTKNALIVVDIQYDFLPGGALAVAGGDEVIPVINRLTPHFELVVATQDWHPPDHGSFASNHPGAKLGDLSELGGLPQILWPDHCVQGSPGAEFHPKLDRSRIARVFRKGTDREIDSYSGFYDNGHRKSTGLGEFLRAQGVTDVTIAGLATDYCVRWTALDALKLGFRTHVVADACRGVNLQPDDSAKALEEVRRAGGEIVQSETARAGKLPTILGGERQ